MKISEMEAYVREHMNDFQKDDPDSSFLFISKKSGGTMGEFMAAGVFKDLFAMAAQIFIDLSKGAIEDPQSKATAPVLALAAMRSAAEIISMKKMEGGPDHEKMAHRTIS